MEEKRTKLCFSITSKPKTPAAAFSVPAHVNSTSPAPRYITAFDPSHTLDAPARPPAVVIAPLPDTRRRPTVVHGPVFVPADASSDNNIPPSSSASYGLSVRDMAERKRRRLAAAQDAAADQRFKQDMAALPDDVQGAEEYGEVPVEGFGAALLAGYGWKEGRAIGRDKTKVDVKIVERGRRSGMTNGLGADPMDKNDPTVTPVVRRSVRVLQEHC